VNSDQSRLELGKWMTEMCGVCHPAQKGSYLENYHGKAAVHLKYEASAYCADCHGAHTCLSLKKREEALEVCKKCHPNAQIQFTDFVIHASEEGVKKEDVEKLKKLKAIKRVEIGFGILVVAVLAFFYSHTLVWTLRKVHEWLKGIELMAVKETEVFWRFNVFHRFIHLVMMVTFIGLALTGLPLKYSDTLWAQGLIFLWGGVKGAGIFHRWFAGITFGYFSLHLLWVFYYVLVLKGNLFGPDSMVPSKKDFKDLFQHIAYFLGRGEPPQFGRFTYWEKFDYWAVFWGIAFIGGSGLVLWFPEFFSRFLQGIFFNIAYTIHSDEALLAAGFIFIVHLYNAHLRAHIFPIDKSIFTGKIEAREIMERHPLEWEYLNQYPDKKKKRTVRKDLFLVFLTVFLVGMIPVYSFARGLTDEELMEAEKKLCWRCHRQPNLNSNEGITASILLCMDCHGKKDVEKKVDGRPVSLYLDQKEYGKTVHRRIACVRCHDGIATSPHRTSLIECASCHGYHGEGKAHDPHPSVNCEACHHESKEVMKDPKTGRIVLMTVKEGIPLKMTSHRLADFKRIRPAKNVISLGINWGRLFALPA
jgi:cytochrome b subunit of formate dehydrogenase